RGVAVPGWRGWAAARIGGRCGADRRQQDVAVAAGCGGWQQGAVGSGLAASGACAPGALDGLDDQPLRLLRVAPAEHLRPLRGFEVLVMLEKVLDLADRDLGQIRVAPDLLVAPADPRHGHGDDLLVAAG